MDLSVFALIVIGLASYRITRFFVFDSLIGTDIESGSRFSIWFDDQCFNGDGTERSWLRGKIGDLMHCPWCFGWWVSVAATAWWVQLPDLRWALYPWAVAAIQGVTNQVDQFLGQKAS